jgi:hypothetical protein
MGVNERVSGTCASTSGDVRLLFARTTESKNTKHKPNDKRVKRHPHQSGDAVMDGDGRLGPHFGMPVLCVLEQLLECGGRGEGGRQGIESAVGLLTHKLLVLGGLQEQLKELQGPQDLCSVDRLILIYKFQVSSLIIWMLEQLLDSGGSRRSVLSVSSRQWGCNQETLLSASDSTKSKLGLFLLCKFCEASRTKGA